MSKALELAHVIMEPLRLKIIKSLLKKPQYISQIATANSSDRSTISYHLGVLEKSGLLTSQYQVLVQPQSKGKAARMYRIDINCLNRALEEIERILPELKPSKD